MTLNHDHAKTKNIFNMSKKIPKKIITNKKTFKLFQCEVPAQWGHKIIENIPTFYDIDAGWSLQFVESQNAINNDTQISDHMLFYLHRNKLDLQKQKIEKFYIDSQFSVLACSFAKEERFWRVYMGGHEDDLLIVLLNSDEPISPDFIEIIHEILKSISFVKN